VPYISENIKIICAICNKFVRPLSSVAAEEDEILAAKMKFLSKEINSLKSFVEENNLERKSAKWEITEDIKRLSIPRRTGIEEHYLWGLSIAT
jgi:DNA gyrase/topoisomerase IV subunit A